MLPAFGLGIHFCSLLLWFPSKPLCMWVLTPGLEPLQPMGTFPHITKGRQSLEPRRLWANTALAASAGPSANPCLLTGWRAKISLQSRRRSTAFQHVEEEAVAIPYILLHVGT